MSDTNQRGAAGRFLPANNCHDDSYTRIAGKQGDLARQFGNGFFKVAKACLHTLHCSLDAIARSSLML